MKSSFYYQNQTVDFDQYFDQYQSDNTPQYGSQYYQYEVCFIGFGSVCNWHTTRSTLSLSSPLVYLIES